MLVLILVGILCAKTGIINQDSNRQLSSLVLQVVNPAVILMSFQTDYRPELARNLLITFGLAAAAFIIMIGASCIFVRNKPDKDSSIERFASVYSNCGFMGIPLMNALFGSEGVFYLTAFITVFNISVWTHGVILISGERSIKQAVRVLCSPTIIAIALGIIMFFAQIRIPSVPAQAFQFIADMNTPLAMLVSGITISSANIVKLLKKPGVYYVCLLKLIVMPLILMTGLAFLPISEKVQITILVAAAAPPAAMCTLFALRYKKNSLYASEIFAAGTVLSVATLPLIVKLAEKISETV